MKAYKITFTAKPDEAAMKEAEASISGDQKAQGVRVFTWQDSEKSFLQGQAQAVFARENKLATFNQMLVLADEIKAAEDSLILSAEDLKRLQVSIENTAKRLGEEGVKELFKYRALLSQFEKPEEIEITAKEKAGP